MHKTLLPTRWLINHKWTSASLTNHSDLTGEGLRASLGAHARTSTDTHTHWQCAWTCVCLHPHAFYQSNLTGKSMIWLANRELMQSPPPPPQSSLIYLSHVPLLLILLPLSWFSFSFFPLLVSRCGEQENNSCTLSGWCNTPSRLMSSVTLLAGFGL